jgi:hypothetical protein
MKRYIVALLWTNNLLIPCLTDSSTSPKMAEAIAALARRVDPQLPAKLVGFVLERTDFEPPECLERILVILKSMPDSASFRPLLTPLLRHPNARIRSKVALLAGEGNRNRTWFERRMLEDDPRVRANAIESAGQAVAEDLRPLFRTAALDSNNRVVGNALIALYRLGSAEAVASLHDLVFRPEPAFRATGVWAMGETGDTRFLPVLARILTDPNETTKAAAFRAIRKLRGRDDANALPLNVSILTEPVSCDTTLKIAFGVTAQAKPVMAIPETEIRILVDGECAYRYSVTEQESPRQLSAAFLLARSGIHSPESRERQRRALELCFAQRRPGDGWLVAQHSGLAVQPGPARSEVLFGVRMDSANVSPVRTIKQVQDIRDVLASREMNRSPDFTTAFVNLCLELRRSRGSAHLFVLYPESGESFDFAGMLRAAKEARVAVHSVCESPDEVCRRICESTGGFYRVDDPGVWLPAAYGGLSHRYQAVIHPQSELCQVQIAVRLADSYGESPILELSRRYAKVSENSSGNEPLC